MIIPHNLGWGERERESGCRRCGGDDDEDGGVGRIGETEKEERERNMAEYVSLGQEGSENFSLAFENWF